MPDPSNLPSLDDLAHAQLKQLVTVLELDVPLNSSADVFRGAIRDHAEDEDLDAVLAAIEDLAPAAAPAPSPVDEILADLAPVELDDTPTPVVLVGAIDTVKVGRQLARRAPDDGPGLPVDVPAHVADDLVARGDFRHATNEDLAHRDEVLDAGDDSTPTR